MIPELGGYWTNLMSNFMMCKFLLGWKENLRKGTDFINWKTRERIVDSRAWWKYDDRTFCVVMKLMVKRSLVLGIDREIQLLELPCPSVRPSVLPRQNFSRIIDIGIIHVSRTHVWGSMILDICIIHICIRINDQRSRIIDVCIIPTCIIQMCSIHDQGSWIHASYIHTSGSMIIYTCIIHTCIIPKCIIPRCIIQICSIPTFIKIKDHGHMPHTYMHQDQWS